MGKYCFFDIDGVLNKSSEWTRMYSLNDECIKNLCILVKEEYLTLIMTSSWRTGFEGPKNPQNTPQIKDLEARLAKYGVVIDSKTPILKGRSRDIEIERYLYYHPCEKYIIIDDDKSEYTKIDEHNYFTNSSSGLTGGDVKVIKKMIRRL